MYLKQLEIFSLTLSIGFLIVKNVEVDWKRKNVEVDERGKNAAVKWLKWSSGIRQSNVSLKDKCREINKLNFSLRYIMQRLIVDFIPKWEMHREEVHSDVVDRMVVFIVNKLWYRSRIEVWNAWLIEQSHLS